MLNRSKPFVDVKKIVNCFSTDDYLNENNINEFENKFSKYINSPMCIATDMGRTSLYLALKIMDIKKGDEVILPTYIWAPVINSILSTSATPVLVDSLKENYCISPLEIKKKITSKTKAILAVHINGVPCDIEEIRNIAIDHGCYLIEDCAHTLSAKYLGKNIGSFGDISFFSFHYDKPISTGWGGMLVINNKEMFENTKKVINQYKRMPINEEKKAIYGLLVQHLLTKKEVYKFKISAFYGEMQLRNNPELFKIMDVLISNKASEQEIQNKVIHYLKNNNMLSNPEENFGYKVNPLIKGLKSLKSKYTSLSQLKIEKINSKYLLMNSLRSLVGSIGLETIDNVTKKRIKNAELYMDLLKDNKSYILPTIDEKKKAAYLRYAILNNTKHPISKISKMAELKGHEIGNYNWTAPAHLNYPYNKILSFKRKNLQVSEFLSKHILDLPVHYYVDNTDIEEIVKILNQFNN